MAHQMTETPFDILLSPKRSTLRPKQIVHREEAQSLIELALMMPLFILLLLGTTEFARFAWAAVLTASAARAGAQYGCQNAATAADTAGIQAYAASDSVNLTGLTTTSSVSCICSNGASIPSCSNALASCAAPATILDYVQVNTSATVTPLGHYPGLPTSFTATGQSIMVVEQ
jgi:Flp pilus assembly protein TadG